MYRQACRAIYNMSSSVRRTKILQGHLGYAMSTAADSEVILEQQGDKGIITLNRPKALNSLNLSMVRTIYPQLQSWAKDKAISMVLIKGTGDKAFCAGGDIIAVTEKTPEGRQIAKDFFKEEYMLNYAIGTLPKPYVALIHGITMGGGVGLSVHGKFRVATEKTTFAMPETAIGLFPDVGGGYFLPRLPGKLGVYLALTGFRLKGLDVMKANVATHYVQSEQLSKLTEELIQLQVSGPESVAQLLNHYQAQSLPSPDPEFVLQPRLADIDRLFSGTTIEQIMADLRSDGSDWANKQADTIAKMSPVSLKITLRQLLEGGSKSLSEVLQMEYRLSQRCAADHDFSEGVRALLVDKDQKPQWQPAHIPDVTDDKIQEYFSPLPQDRELIL